MLLIHYQSICHSIYALTTHETTNKCIVNKCVFDIQYINLTLLKIFILLIHYQCIDRSIRCISKTLKDKLMHYQLIINSLLIHWIDFLETFMLLIRYQSIDSSDLMHSFVSIIFFIGKVKSSLIFLTFVTI